MTENRTKSGTKTGFIYDDVCLEHKTTPGHPERPERLVEIAKRLKAEGIYSELLKLNPAPAGLDWIETVHSPDYIERARRSCENNAGYLDSMDVPISARSYEVAVMAAGGMLAAVDAVM